MNQIVVMEKYCKYGHLKDYQRPNSKYQECRVCSRDRSRKSKKNYGGRFMGSRTLYLVTKKWENKKYYNPEKNRERKQFTYYLFMMQKQAIDFVIEPILIDELGITENDKREDK